VNAVSEVETGPGVKNGPIALGSYTPLILAAAYSSPDAVKVLLDAGAKVNAQDVRGMTPLMLAIACDHNDVRTVRLLLDRGADPKLKSKAGEDAYDWARKFRVPEIMAALNLKEEPRKIMTGAAASRVDIAPAVRKSVALLQKSTAKFLVEGGCAACHAHNMTSAAVAAARARGIPADDNAVADQMKATRFGWAAFEQPMLQRTDPPGAPDSTGYAILDFIAAKHPADRTTDAMVFNMAAQQRSAGQWGLGFVARPPIEDGDFSRTALAIRTLQFYGMPARKAEFDQRIARAKAWLMKSEPRTTEDRNMKLLGVQWAGTGQATIRKLAADILAHQNADGGWAQTPYLDSDAYATGQSLYALAATGVSPRDAAYERGIAFLLRTQSADGSWRVASRSPKFQPYFESGFPYGHDQWISAMATSWAVLALAPAVEPGPAIARL
jgi:Ankyrin repeats (3 copies)/Squalene-hopene cyclase C-terminal domain